MIVGLPSKACTVYQKLAWAWKDACIITGMNFNVKFQYAVQALVCSFSVIALFDLLL